MPSSRPQKISNNRWEEYRPIIQRLYLKRTLQGEDGHEGVISYMSRVYGFDASLSQYEARLKDWGVRKNLTQKDWIAVKDILDERDAQNKKSVVYISGKLLEDSQVRKGVSRPGVRNASRQDNQPRRLDIELPSYLEIRSPELIPQQEKSVQEDKNNILGCGSLFSAPRLLDEESLDVAESPLLHYGSRHMFSNRETQCIDNNDYVVQTRVTSQNTEWPHIEVGLDIVCQEGIKRAIYSSIPSDTLSCINIPSWNLNRLERAEIRGSLQRIPRTAYINSIKSMIPVRHSSNLADITQGASIFRIAIYELVNQTFQPRQEFSEPVKWMMQYMQRNKSPRFFQKLKRCLHSPSFSDAVYRNLFLAAMCVNAFTVMNSLLIASTAPISIISSILSTHNYTSGMTAILFRGPSELVATIMACCDPSTTLILKQMVRFYNKESCRNIKRRERFKVLFENAKLLCNQGFDLDWPSLVESAVFSGDSNIVKQIISLIPSSKYGHLFERNFVILEDGFRDRVDLPSKVVRNLSEEDTLWTFRTLVHYLLSSHLITDSSSTPGQIISTGLPNPFRSRYQKSTLELAIAREYDSVVEYLISQGAQVTAGCLYHATCLKRLGLIEQFLNAGASPFEIIYIDESGSETTTSYAEALRTDYYEAMRLFDQLSQFTPNIDAQRTLLIAASEIGDRERFSKYIGAIKQNSMDITEFQSHIRVAEATARKYGHKQIFDALFEAGAIPALELFQDAITFTDHDRVKDLFTRANGTSLPGVSQAITRLENHDTVKFMLECIDIQEVVAMGEFLKQAVQFDNLVLVKHLLHMGVSPNSLFDIKPFHIYDPKESIQQYITSLETPLILAIRRRNKQIVDILLENLAFLNPQPDDYDNMDGTGPLFYYIQHKYRPRFFSALEAAVYAQDIDLVYDLVSRGADPYDSDALVGLVKLGLCDVIKRILPIKEFVKISKASNVLPALAEALRRGNIEMVCLLSLHAYLDHLSIRKDDVSLFCYRNDDIRDDGKYNLSVEMTVLGYAIHEFVHGNCSLSMIRTLLRSGSHPDKVCLVSRRKYGSNLGNNTRTFTPLNLAVFWNSEALLNLLIEHHANIKVLADNTTKRTPLQLSTELGRLDMVSRLIELGADVNSPPSPCKGFTALQLAAKHGFYPIAELLLDHQVDVDCPAAKVCGRTAFEAATENGRLDMMLLLVRNGADLISSAGSKQFERAIQFAEARGEKPAIMLAHELRGIVQRVTLEAQDEAFKSLLDKVFEY